MDMNDYQRGIEDPNDPDKVLDDIQAQAQDHQMVNDLTLKAIQAESIRAHLKHVKAGGSLLIPGLSTTRRLAALVEEVGEVARALTYDNDQGKDHLVKELIQVANVAASWAQFLDTYPMDWL